MIQGLQAIAEATGQVKGSLGNPSADPPLQPSGKLDVGGAVGHGGNDSCIGNGYLLCMHTHLCIGT